MEIVNQAEVNILENEYSLNELNKVFAMNIQVSQMKEIIPQYEWNENRFEEEREYFFWWLNNPSLGGKYNFKDNLTAWETYKFSHEIIEIDDDDEFSPSWAEEIDQAISNAIRYANYNDFGGQL